MRLNIIIAIGIGILAYGGVHSFWGHSLSKDRVLITQEKDMREKVPDFSFVDAQGQTYEIDHFKGKIVLLNFWASWCAPCIQEFPALLDVAQTYPNDVILIALSSDITMQAMVTFIKEHNLRTDNMIVAYDKDGRITSDIFNVEQLPVTFVLDQTHHIRTVLKGTGWMANNEYELKKQIEDLLL